MNRYGSRPALLGLALAATLILGLPASAAARTTFLASTGPDGGNGADIATYAGASFDGSRLFIETTESLVAADSESPAQVDVYERRGGITTLVSVSSTAGNGAYDAHFVGKSLDGTHVFFETSESLVAGDSDGGFKDVYERFDGATTLVSAEGNGPFDATRAGGPLGGVTPPVSDDGTKFFFETSEPLTGDDVETGSNVDVYERSGGTTTLVSTGASAGGTAFDASFDGISTSGHRAFFHTTERFSAGDTDSVRDIYERSAGVTELVSTGPSGGNGAFAAEFKEPDSPVAGGPAVQGSISSDGEYAFFQTTESLVNIDTDGARDVYRRSLSGAGTIKISEGNGVFPALFKGASLDGQAAAWVTRESLTGPCASFFGDFDGNSYDAYGALIGLGCAHLSAGPQNALIDVDINAAAAADNGAYYFFQTREQLVAEDVDSQLDVYQATGGGLPVLASKGPDGGNGPYDAALANGRDDSDVTADGMHAFFVTAERLDATADQDNAPDIYERDVASGTASLMSTGATPSVLDIAPTFGAIARNGSRAYYMTTESLVSDDADVFQDVYSADLAADSASSPSVPPGGTVSTTPDPTPSDPVGTSVTTPDGGAVSISEQLDSGAPTGYTGLGWQVDISAPPASDPSDPLVLTFRADASLLPPDFSTVQVFKDGVEVPNCLVPGGTTADPDPCVSARTLLPNGDGELTILTTTASAWAFAIENGSVTIVKDAQPDGPQAFDFTSGGVLAGGAFQLDDDGDDSNALSNTRTFSDLVPGNGYSVTESVPAGWTKAATCDDGSDPSNIDVPPGENVTCTFVNQKRGEIVVVQDSAPNDPQDFSFTADSGLTPANFQLDDDADSTLSNTRTFADLVSGNGYSLAQSLPAGWYLGSASCDDGSPISNIDVANGETVTCTFVNSVNHPRPGGGTPLRVPLVPSFNPCTSPNATHVGPIDEPSCSPPSMESGQLTTGTTGNQVSFAKLEVFCNGGASGEQPPCNTTAGDQLDVRVTTQTSDVRKRSDGTDYTGKVILQSDLRQTDRANDPGGVAAGTAQDSPFSIPIDCVATASTSVGSNCNLTTTLDSLLLANFAKEVKRAVVSTFSLKLLDAGADGSVTPPSGSCPYTCGSGDETVYLQQGVFTP